MGRQLCKLNGVAVNRKISRRGNGAKNEDKEDGFGCILLGSGREFEARLEAGS
jgi:hypothetical protein